MYNKSLIYFLLLFLIFGISHVEAQNFSDETYVSKLRRLEIENQFNIGVYAFDTKSNKVLAYNSDKRFAYCSTHKVFTAAEILRRYSNEQLKEIIYYTQYEVLSYAPITKLHVEQGMSLFDICEAAVRFSDNTAANLMLNKLGGSVGFKSALRGIGDEVSNPVRLEPELNEILLGDDSDTSTPRQMALNLQKYVFGDVLNDEQKQILTDWMSDNEITNTLIKSGVPNGWQVLDKSGSGNYGTRNDIAIIYPPNRNPIIVAIMTNHNNKNDTYDDKLIVEITKIIIDTFQQDM